MQHSRNMQRNEIERLATQTVCTHRQTENQVSFLLNRRPNSRLLCISTVTRHQEKNIRLTHPAPLFFFYLKATFLSSFLLFSFFASATMSCVSGVASLCSDFVKSIHNKFYNAVSQHEENEDEREHKYQTTFHRFGSFAPVRHGAQVKFFVDGHDYCWCVLSNNASGYS